MEKFKTLKVVNLQNASQLAKKLTRATFESEKVERVSPVGPSMDSVLVPFNGPIRKLANRQSAYDKHR